MRRKPVFDKERGGAQRESRSCPGPLVLYIVYSVGLNAPLKRGRRCFFHTLAKANAKANAPLKPERRAKSQNECPPNAPLNAPPPCWLPFVHTFWGIISVRCAHRALLFLSAFSQRPAVLHAAGRRCDSCLARLRRTPRASRCLYFFLGFW